MYFQVVRILRYYYRTHIITILHSIHVAYNTLRPMHVVRPKMCFLYKNALYRSIRSSVKRCSSYYYYFFLCPKYPSLNTLWNVNKLLHNCLGTAIATFNMISYIYCVWYKVVRVWYICATVITTPTVAARQYTICGIPATGLHTNRLLVICWCYYYYYYYIPLWFGSSAYCPSPPIINRENPKRATKKGLLLGGDKYLSNNIYRKTCQLGVTRHSSVVLIIINIIFIYRYRKNDCRLVCVYSYMYVKYYFYNILLDLLSFRPCDYVHSQNARAAGEPYRNARDIVT